METVFIEIDWRITLQFLHHHSIVSKIEHASDLLDNFRQTANYQTHWSEVMEENNV